MTDVSLSQKSLAEKCRQINAGMSSRWHRVFSISYHRCKAGMPSNYASFTLREKFYTWTGL